MFFESAKLLKLDVCVVAWLILCCVSLNLVLCFVLTLLIHALDDNTRYSLAVATKAATPATTNNTL